MKSLENEVWKRCNIEGYTSYYVSNRGRVYRKNEYRHKAYEIKSFETRKCITHTRRFGNRVRKYTYLYEKPYKAVFLHNDINRNQRIFKFVHYLVAISFIGPRPEGFVIDHIDGNKQNNNVENLRYVTIKENCKRRFCRLKRIEK